MKTTARSAVLVTAIALALAASPLYAADRMRVGRWEVTSTSNGRTNTFKNCLSAADAGAMNGDAKTSQAYSAKLLPAQCKFTDYKVDGNVVTWVMTCGDTRVRSSTTYRGDSYQSDSTTKTGSAPEVVSHISAKRIGDCP